MQDRYVEIKDRDWGKEVTDRVNWLQGILETTGAKGFVFGNSGGKDASLVGALCSMASINTTGVIMPCNTKQNFGSDREHAELLADKFKIHTKVVNMFTSFLTFCKELPIGYGENVVNVAPRLRMTVLYEIAWRDGLLVIGTGNRSERYLGYFTKFGDGACDFNPIADLTASEVYHMSKFLGIPDEILEKAPSAGLKENQTDEGEMGMSYREIDGCLLGMLTPSSEVLDKINKMHRISEHKRNMPKCYGEM